jgi:hypothetical protein
MKDKLKEELKKEATPLAGEGEKDTERKSEEKMAIKKEK